MVVRSLWVTGGCKGELPRSCGAQVRDGFVHGRGAIDDKQAVVGICEAVEFLLSEVRTMCRQE